MKICVKESIVLIFLTCNTLFDIRKREISLLSVAALSLIGLVWMAVDRTVFYEPKFQSFLASVGTGMLFLLISVLTNGKLGMGDAWILVALGTMLSMQMYFLTILTGWMLASLWSFYLIVFRKKKRTTEIPFLPFLLAGYLGGVLLC